MANMGLSLSGSIALEAMPRLVGSLYDTQGSVYIDLAFGKDEQRIAYLRGSIRANLLLVCQRCLQPMKFSVFVEPCLGLVTSVQQMEVLPDNYEPLLLETQTMSLTAIVEDELMLDLPLVPKHDDEECKKQKTVSSSEDVLREHPFAILTQLKKPDHS
jgi:uncharacterized protein